MSSVATIEVDHARDDAGVGAIDWSCVTSDLEAQGWCILP